MHKGGQEQLILKVCQPTLLGHLVNDRTEDHNLQTQQHCSGHGCSRLIFGPNKAAGYRRGHGHASADGVEIKAHRDKSRWLYRNLQSRMVLSGSSQTCSTGTHLLGATGQTVVWGNNGGPNGCDNPKHAAADHIQGARKQQYSPQIAAKQESQVALELNTNSLTSAHLDSITHSF